MTELSPAQARIMAALVAGKSIEEIATEMGVTPSTVCTQISRVREKLGAHTTAQAAALFERRRRLSRRMAQELQRGAETPKRPDDVLLTCLARGMSTKEIAADLGVVPDTVRQRVRRQRELLGARNNEQLVARYAARIADLPIVGWMTKHGARR